jgi:hypothetical protein
MSGLAVPSPYTASTGSFITAALWNTQVRDAVSFLADPPRFSGLCTTSPTIATGSTGFTTLSIDTEIYDTEGGHSPSTNPSRYTAVYAGLYKVTYSVSYGVNSTGSRAARITVNGAQPSAPGSVIQSPTPTTVSWVGAGSFEVFLNVGDYVELGTFQTSGGNMTPNSTNCGFSLIWLAKS